MKLLSTHARVAPCLPLYSLKCDLPVRFISMAGLGPLATFLVREDFRALGEIVLWLGRRGQAQGLPLREHLRGKTARVGDVGRHKAWAYGSV